MIGGTLPLLKAGHRVGGGDTIIMESCEYYNSFHAFYPTVAVILNIEPDHLDFFSGIDEIKDSFRSLDCKTKLQEIIQRNGENTLKYEIVGESGPDHDKRFTVEVHLNSNVIGRGVGKSKKLVEQEAAHEALTLMGINI